MALTQSQRVALCDKYGMAAVREGRSDGALWGCKRPADARNPTGWGWERLGDAGALVAQLGGAQATAWEVYATTTGRRLAGAVYATQAAADRQADRINTALGQQLMRVRALVALQQVAPDDGRI
jgi:hypothetical protein